MHSPIHTRVAVEEVARESVYQGAEPATERVHVVDKEGVMPALRLGRLQELLSRISIGVGRWESILMVCQKWYLSVTRPTNTLSSIQILNTPTFSLISACSTRGTRAESYARRWPLSSAPDMMAVCVSCGRGWGQTSL